MIRRKRVFLSIVVILIFSLITTTFRGFMVEGQASNSKFDLEIERDPNTMKPKIMVLKEENKIAVKVRNNGPNSTKCEVGVRITGGYSSLNPDGYVKFKGKSNFKVEVAPNTQTWVFVPITDPDVDLDEELEVEAWVANEVDIHDGEGLYFLEGADTNPTNNGGSKDFFVDHKLSAGSIGNTNFVIENPSEDNVTIVEVLTLPLTPVPYGWILSVRRLSNFEILTSGAPNGTILTLMPDEKFYGIFTIQTPKEVMEGQSINVRLMARHIGSEEIIFAKEIFAAYDNKPPTIIASNVTSNGGFLEAWLSTQDSSSGVEVGEIYFSTDEGETWSSKQMSYSFDMELVYDKLTSKIGPFTNGTEVECYFNVKDGVGNWAFTTPETITIEMEDEAYTELKQKNEALQSSYNSLLANFTSFQSSYNSLLANFTSFQSSYDSLLANFTSLETKYADLEADFGSMETANAKIIGDYADLTRLLLYISVGAAIAITVLGVLLLRCRTQNRHKS